MNSWIEKIRHNHGLLMILCMGIPLIALLASTYFFNLSKSYLLWLVILLCPLTHYFMMKDMHKGKNEDEKGGHH